MKNKETSSLKQKETKKSAETTCTTVVAVALPLRKEKTMTTQELSKVLGVSDRTIRKTVESLGEDFRKNISESSTGGRPTMMFTEAQATAVKVALKNHSKVNDLSPKTMTEKMMLI